MQSIWWGQQTYEKIQGLQRAKVPELSGQRQIEIWGLEFEPTVTLGLRARIEKDLKSSPPSDFKIIKTDRGGRATLHSPGQLVIFPMIDLKAHRIAIPDFVQILFRSTMDFLGRHQIQSFSKSEDPGVYTEKGKIAFCGIKVDSGVVRHGLSVNIHNELDLFDSLIPCGNPSLSLDRLANYNLNADGKALKMEEAFAQWCESFRAQGKALGFS